MSHPVRHLRFHILAALAACEPGALGPEGFAGTACMTVEPGVETCPAKGDVDANALEGECGSTILKVTSEGELRTSGVGWPDSGPADFCCYAVMETEATCDYGRPYMEQGAPRVAPTDDGDPAWIGDPDPALAGLSDAERAALAGRWASAASDEHAAIAAFARVSLELLAVGAPPALLAATHQAAIDEVEHARLGFGLASRYAGRPVAPGRFPFGLPVLPTGDLVALAVSTAREGCVGETVATMLALAALPRTTDPAARRVLEVIVRDETRHVELAWRTVRWAIARGGDEVAQAVREVFVRAARTGVAVPLRGEAEDTRLLAAHGLLTRAQAVAAGEEALRRVILPCAEALFIRGTAEVQASV